MTLKEKATEITEFQTRMLQDFFILGINNCSSFKNVDWREKFEYCVMHANPKFASNYNKGKLLLSRNTPVEITDMDITLMMTLLRHNFPFKSIINNDEVQSCLAGFTAIRNTNSHRTAHETDLDYYRWFSGVLFNADQFLDLIPNKLNWMNQCADGNVFITKYKQEISDLTNRIDEELKSYVIGDYGQYAIEFDVSYIMGSGDPARTFNDVYRKYMMLSARHPSRKNYDYLISFLTKCADNKIMHAWHVLSRHYYEGDTIHCDPPVIIDPDYKMAARYHCRWYLSSKDHTPHEIAKFMEFIVNDNYNDYYGNKLLQAIDELKGKGYSFYYDQNEKGRKIVKLSPVKNKK